MLFFLGSISFFIGIGIGSYGGSLWDMIFVLLCPLLLIWITGIRSLMAILIIISTTVSGIYLSSSTYTSHVHATAQLSQATAHFSTKVSMTGTIDQILYRGELSQAYRLHIDNIVNISTGSVEVGDLSGVSILLDVPENLHLGRGDQITLKGKIQPLFSGSIDGFEKYTLFKNVSGKISISSFHTLSRGEVGLLDQVSNWTETHIFRGFPRDIAGVILGMTIGRVELMSREIQESFRTSGISHILVVSGSNITFLIVLISGILRYTPLSRRYRISIITLFIILYSTLVGWDVPVVRSTIMGLLAFFAIEYHSRVSSLAILFLIGDILLIFSPLSLIYDPAFGLSFAATMSIILYYSPILSRLRAYHIPDIFGTTLALTIAASLGTLPVTIYHFSTVSFGFLFANIAISFIVGWILFMSVWYIVLGFFGEMFLYIFGFLIYLPVYYIIEVSRFFSAWGVWEVPVDIGNIAVLLFLAFFIGEIIGQERLLPEGSRKMHDHSRSSHQK